MPEQGRRPAGKDAPGGIIASYAFNYAVKFYDFAAAKYPGLMAYAPDHRNAMHQAAIVVASLIQLERRSAASAELREGLASAFPHSARRRCLTAIQSLSSELLKAGVPAEGIPSYAPLAGADDKHLAGSIGSWLARSIMGKAELAQEEKPMAAAMGRSAWTSAVMIVRLLKKTS